MHRPFESSRPAAALQPDRLVAGNSVREARPVTVKWN